MDEHADIDRGVAGRSAARQAERTRARLELESAGTSRLRTALFGPSAKAKRLATEQRNWVVGAKGEVMLAETLARRCPAALLLHDRRMPRSRANIDHIAVAGGGVFVIDAKRYRGKIEVRAPLFGKEKLLIAGRDRTKLVEGLRRQVLAVEAVLADTAPDVPVHGCLCFLTPDGFLSDSGLPVLRTLKVAGFPLYYPRRLAKRLRRPGDVDVQQARSIHSALALRLPPA